MSPMQPTGPCTTSLPAVTPTQPSTPYHPPSSEDFRVGLGFFTGRSTPFTSSSPPGPFPPGSPLASFLVSFGSRFYPPGSPGPLLGPLDPNYFSFLKMSSSTESEHDGSIRETALIMPEKHDALCRDYKCCAVKLPDLHSLVEHFESHVVALDPYAPRPLLPTSTPFLSPVSKHMRHHHPESNTASFMAFHGEPERHLRQEQAQPCLLDMDNMKPGVNPTLYSAPWSRAPGHSNQPIRTPFLGSPTSASFLAAYSSRPSAPMSPPMASIPASDTTKDLSSRANPHPYLRHPQPRFAYKHFNLDDMELYVDPSMNWAPLSRASPPSGLSLSTPLSDSLTSTPCLVANSAVPSPPPSLPISPISASDVTGVLSPRSKPNDDCRAYLHHPLQSAGYAESSCSDQDVALPPMNGLNGVMDGSAASTQAAPPLSGSSGNTTDSSPPSLFVASPILGRPEGSGYKESSRLPRLVLRLGAGPYPSSIKVATSRSNPDLLQASWMSRLKPFKCPNAHCNKLYKQPNSLKYHTAHRSCTLGPPKDLEKFEELLAQKRTMKGAATGARENVMLSEADLREVQKEVEERL